MSLAYVAAGVLVAAALPAIWSATHGSRVTVSEAAADVTPEMREISFWSPDSRVWARRHADRVPLELGTRFSVATDGWVAGLRFFKAPSDRGAHTGSLWDAQGTRLATVAFTGETRAGWQEARFTDPVEIAAGQAYTISYHNDRGTYVAQAGLRPIQTGPLSMRPRIGVFKYGESGFPQGWNRRNFTYFVDPIYRWAHRPPGTPSQSPTPSVSVAPSASASPTPTATPTPTPSPSDPSPTPSRTFSATPQVPEPGGARVCPSGYPTPACTGVPPGTDLRELAANYYDAYRVTKDNTVLDGVHIHGDLLITANNVVIKNSLIDGQVKDEYERQLWSFTITDSTVGSATGCNTAPGIETANFTATRVHIRGHGDGFSVSGDNVVIRDSFVLLCSNPGDHSDGIQTVGPGKGLVFDHNTVDQRDARYRTSPVFLVDASVNVSVTNNLLVGGTYTIRLRNGLGTQVARNNAVVNGAWDFGPVDAQCSVIDWRDNTLVTIDDNYRVTSTVGPLRCDG